jgi:S-(hydroxymethyl)glutathione dehydrogenase/alcohol dehydrogenase
LELAEVLVPSKLEVGQVLVEVHASGICGAQVGEISGFAGPDKYLPHLLGHEGGGIVRGVGLGVTNVEVGDHVVMHWRKGDGIEARPAKYRRALSTCEVGAGPVHTFCDHAIVSENRVTTIPEDIPFEIAALMGCAITTGLGLINNEAQLKIGQTIAVAGCGGVGLNIIQGAHLAGASRIVAIDIHDFKLGLAMKFGATGTRNYVSDYIEVDVFVDCTGIPEVIEASLECVVPGGKMILVGQPREGLSLVLPDMRQHYCGKTIMDSQGGLTNPTIDIPRYVRMYQMGKLNLDGLITHTLPLDRVNEALEILASGQSGKIILNMGW